MQKIIKAQNGKNPNIYSEDLVLWKYSFDLKADKNGEIKDIKTSIIWLKRLNMV